MRCSRSTPTFDFGAAIEADLTNAVSSRSGILIAQHYTNKCSIGATRPHEQHPPE